MLTIQCRVQRGNHGGGAALLRILPKDPELVELFIELG